MKKLVILAISFLILNNVSAQMKTLKFEAGPSIAFPSGTFNSFAATGFGLEATFLYQLTEKYSLFGTTGFESFGAKHAAEVNSRATFHVPAIVGIRRNCKDFFGGIGIGTGTYDFGHGGYSTTHFAFSPQIGYGKGKIEVAVKYNYTAMSGNNIAYFNITAAYKF